MSTVAQFTLAGSANDAQDDDDGSDFDSGGSQVQMASNTIAGTITSGGFRFTNVTIPARAHIFAADIQVYLNGSTQDDPQLDIYCELVANSVDFATTLAVTSRARTAASTAWSASNIGVGAYKTSGDIAAQVQEVVNLSSWASGNALTVLMISRSAGARLFYVESADHAAPHVALLDVTYDDPYLGSPRTPTVVRQAAQRAATR